MGHDTTAYLGRTQPTDLKSVAGEDELEAEVAYLRGNYGLYDALDAKEYDGGVSGGGIGRWFTRGQLLLGLRRLYVRDRAIAGNKITWRYDGQWRKARHTVKPAIRFLQSCLVQLPASHEALYIDFG